MAKKQHLSVDSILGDDVLAPSKTLRRSTGSPVKENLARAHKRAKEKIAALELERDELLLAKKERLSIDSVRGDTEMAPSGTLRRPTGSPVEENPAGSHESAGEKIAALEREVDQLRFELNVPKPDVKIYKLSSGTPLFRAKRIGGRYLIRFDNNVVSEDVQEEALSVLENFLKKRLSR